MREEENKKIIASFELVLMFLSMFAFSYMISQTNSYFVDAAELKKPEAPEYRSKLSIVKDILIEKIKSPMIPFVSAVDQPGCCQETSSGAICMSSYEDDCVGSFIPGTACEDVSYCETGCCYEPSTGHYSENTIRSSCEAQSGRWTLGSCQSISGARIGCCVIGDTTHTSVTEKECQLLSESYGMDSTDWRLIGEAQCVFLAEAGVMGACVNSEKDCDFVTRSQCPDSSEFYKDYLCTAPTLETTCEKQTLGEYRTMCVDGKDEVYFMDSCGNPANVYDASKINNPSYWTTVQEPTCTVRGSNGEGANDPDCGNCNIGLGGVCSSADEDNFAVDYGQYYCQDMGCSFDWDLDGVDEPLENGESWCMYDGKVGDGDDVVGSSHWKYECSQGEIISTRCGDAYRNNICTDISDSSTNPDFKIATCGIPNTWRQCVSINGEVGDEDELVDVCESYPGCAVEEINIDSNYFHFKICRPEYPGGFDLGSQAGAQVADSYCGAITVECEIPREPNGGLFDWSGGCDYAEDEDGNTVNEGCLSPQFTEQMNELCRSMGDCGATVNIEGEYTENFVVRYHDFEDMSGGGNMPSENKIKSDTRHLNTSGSYVSALLDTAQYLDYQSVEMDLSTFAAGSGLLDDLSGEDYTTGNMSEAWYIVPGAIGGTLYAMAAIAGGGLGLDGLISGFGAIGGAAVGPWLGAAMAAAVGFVAGLLIGNALGFNDNNTIALAAGLGAVGAGLTLIAFSEIPVVGWVVGAIGVLVTIFALIAGFAQDDCDPITIEYVCKPYSPPTGGDDCDKCDDDPLRPCNDYKCESLGSACMIINKGTEYEECAAIPDNGLPPMVTGTNLDEDASVTLGNSGSNYAEIKPASGTCFDAYETIIFGIDLTEQAKCKYSTIQESYEDMNELFGVSAMLENQQMALFIPDPSNGQSQGLNWQGNMEFYIKCEDAYGEISPEFYKISFCVNEGQDTRAPIIEKASPVNGGLASFDTDEQDITITTNEPAQCKWSTSNVAYESMPNQMTCNFDISPSRTWDRPFTCTTTLPTPNPENTFYINCKDQPWLGDDSIDRNSKYENEVYVLKKPEKKITIDWIEPNEDLETGSQLQSVDLKIKTSGGGTWHMCKWSMSGFTTMFDLPLTANKGNTHTIPLNLAPGYKTIYVNCSDETGDTDSSSSSFEIKYDSRPPEVTRIWQESGKLHIITDETGECRYSTEACNFDWADASVISGNYEYILPVIRGQRYYIKCEDEYGNHPSISCSAEVMAV